MSRRDALWIIGFLIAGAFGLTCYIQFYDRAFPVASLNFRVDREQAYRAAETYLHNLGYDLTEYESAQVFSSSGMRQVFLERTLGLAEANRLVRDWVSVWYWHIRYFKPLQKEELRVRIDPGGRVVGFTHSILESDAGASLSEEDARAIAETFLADTQGFQLHAYTPIETSSEKRPNRVDHSFAYRKKDFVIGDDGHYRLTVTIKGDKPGYFSESLKVPETFSRNYREIRSRAGPAHQHRLCFLFRADHCGVCRSHPQLLPACARMARGPRAGHSRFRCQFSRLHEHLSDQPLWLQHHAVLSLFFDLFPFLWADGSCYFWGDDRLVRHGRGSCRARCAGLDQSPRPIVVARLAIRGFCACHLDRLRARICPLGLRHPVLHFGQRLFGRLGTRCHDAIRQCV